MWWRRPSDPLRSIFIGVGKQLPILFDAYLRLTTGWRGETATMVYSDGHSGTSSLSLSLARWGARPVFHVHILCPANLDSQPHYPRGVGWIYYKGLVERRRPLKVISMVRNPVDRWISGFFHSQFDHHVSAPEVPTPALVQRLELADALKEEAVARFVGLEAFRWERIGHVAQGKGYADLCRAFRAEARLSPRTLDRLLETRCAQHFYTEAERLETRRRWTAPTEDLHG